MFERPGKFCMVRRDLLTTCGAVALAAAGLGFGKTSSILPRRCFRTSAHLPCGHGANAPEQPALSTLERPGPGPADRPGPGAGPGRIGDGEGEGDTDGDGLRATHLARERRAVRVRSYRRPQYPIRIPIHLAQD